MKKEKNHLLSIIGEVEGHENASGGSKTTKYDHVLPALAQIEDDATVEGLLVLLNTSGGDVDAGLAIAEMIASLSIPHGFPGAGRGTFHRCTPWRYQQIIPLSCQVLPWCPSGTPERNVHRCSAVLPQYGKDPGPDHCLCIRTFTYHGRTDGGADAGYLPACKRCGDYAGG